MIHLNYNHLYYFWMVATEGSIVRASEKLHVTPQTISGQLGTLEDAIGARLFSKAGRNLILTEFGHVVFSYADDMFRLGRELKNVLEGGMPGTKMVFNVGVAMVVPKLIAYRVLEPALHIDKPIRMVCHENLLETLLADLSVHRLDLVLADSPIGPTLNVRAFNHFLGECGVTFFASKGTGDTFRSTFPKSLNDRPILLPSTSSELRGALDQWFDTNSIHPHVVAEFEDGALMKAFGEAGAGVFIAPVAIEKEIIAKYNVEIIGRTEQVKQRFYAITPEKRLKNPAVVSITDSARTLFATETVTKTFKPSLHKVHG